MATFHPFPRLPAELRSQIWKLTTEPRIVDVMLQYKRDEYGRQIDNDKYLVWHEPSPAVLHTCREARHEMPHQKVFSELAGPEGSRSYVWLALEIDMIHIGFGEALFVCYKSVAPAIRRLMFQCDSSVVDFFSLEILGLDYFENLEHIRILCEDGLRAWHAYSIEYDFVCDAENVVLFDLKSGESVTVAELKVMTEEEVEKAFPADND